jgi:hypothetical protein
MMETVHTPEKPMLLCRYRPFFNDSIIPEEPVSVDEALESKFYTEYIAKDETGYFIANIDLENISGSVSSMHTLICTHHIDTQKLEYPTSFNYENDKLECNAIKEFIAEYRAFKNVQEIMRIIKDNAHG